MNLKVMSLPEFKGIHMIFKGMSLYEFKGIHMNLKGMMSLYEFTRDPYEFKRDELT